jgi:hypothetical protein
MFFGVYACFGAARQKLGQNLGQGNKANIRGLGGMALTDTGIRALKPAAKIYKAYDAKGLYLEITPSGGKHWRYRYSYAAKDKRIALGSYPEISLEAARKKRGAAAEQVAAGIDPARERNLAKQDARVAAGNSFAALAADYITVKYVNEGRAKATIDKQHFFLSHLVPAFGTVPAGAIRAVEIMAALRTLEKKGHRQTAKCTRAFASRVFRYGVGLGTCHDDPARLLSGNLSAPVVTHRAAIVDPKRLGAFLRGGADCGNALAAPDAAARRDAAGPMVRNRLG